MRVHNAPLRRLPLVRSETVSACTQEWDCPAAMTHEPGCTWYFDDEKHLSRNSASDIPTCEHVMSDGSCPVCDDTTPDPVNSPAHYTWLGGIEVIDITEHLSFTLGNVIKYVLRADHKGRPLEDLEKAAWYLNREIDRRKRTNH